jgi:hypothetical protein
MEWEATFLVQRKYECKWMATNDGFGLVYMACTEQASNLGSNNVANSFDQISPAGLYPLKVLCFLLFHVKNCVRGSRWH